MGTRIVSEEEAAAFSRALRDFIRGTVSVAGIFDAAAPIVLPSPSLAAWWCGPTRVHWRSLALGVCIGVPSGIWLLVFLQLLFSS